jgi:hypothetical protein
MNTGHIEEIDAVITLLQSALDENNVLDEYGAYKNVDDVVKMLENWLFVLEDTNDNEEDGMGDVEYINQHKLQHREMI